MATTHTRIHYALRVVAERQTWTGVPAIANAIRQAKPAEMRMRGDGAAAEHYMSAESIGHLLMLMADLGLITIASDGVVSASAEGGRSARDLDRYDRLIQSSVRSVLERAEIPMEKIHAAIRGIRLPKVPDAKSIHEKLTARTKVSMKLDRFRQLLYLYACAGGIDRAVRVHYGIDREGRS